MPKRKGLEDFEPSQAAVSNANEPSKEMKKPYDVASSFERMSLNQVGDKRISREDIKEKRFARIKERPTHSRTNSAGVAVEEITLKPLRNPRRSIFTQRGVSQTIRR